MNKTGNEIAKIAQIANRLSVRVMRGEGLGPAESDLIRLVREHPGISQKIAGEALGMDKGAVARRAANLEKKGYLSRKNNPADARSQLLYPAEQAGRIRDSGVSAEEAFYRWLLDNLSDQEREAFCETVNELCRKAELESGDGYPNVCELLGRPPFGAESVSGNRSQKQEEKKPGRKNPSKSTAGTEVAENFVNENIADNDTINPDVVTEETEGIEEDRTAVRKTKEPEVWLL